MLGEKVSVVMDRKLGSAHPNYPELHYPVNYGYVPGVMAGDGEEQDVYLLGIDVPMELFTGTVIAVIHRLDDVEDKWVVAPSGMRFTKEEIEAQVSFQEQYFRHEIELEPAGRVLETNRLVLRPASINFAELCVDFYQRNAGFLAQYEPERSAEFYQKDSQQMLLWEEIAAMGEKRAASFYLFEKEKPELLIGKVSLSNVVWGGFCSCFLGYKLDEGFINWGYMTEAVDAIVNYGFGTWGLHRIEANVMPKNVSSLRVLDKCGFEKEGISRNYLKIRGVWEDHVHMVKLNAAME